MRKVHQSPELQAKFMDKMKKDRRSQQETLRQLKSGKPANPQNYSLPDVNDPNVRKIKIIEIF